MRTRRASVRSGSAKAIALVIAALTIGGGVASAAGAGPTVVPGEPTVIFNGGFSPKALSRSTPTPIALTIGIEIRNANGSPPPALSQLRLEFDESISLDFAAIPSCPVGIGEDTPTFERRCKKAFVGAGVVSMRFNDEAVQERPVIGGTAFVYKRNEGPTGTTLGIHEYQGYGGVGLIDLPVLVKENIFHGSPQMLVRPQPGTFSTPITKLSLRIDKKAQAKGVKSSVISAVCREGKLAVQMTATFANGESRSGDLIRECQAKP